MKKNYEMDIYQQARRLCKRIFQFPTSAPFAGPSGHLLRDVAIILAVPLLFLVGCEAMRPVTKPEKSFLVMGTTGFVLLPEHDADQLDSVAGLVTNTMLKLESKFSVYRSSSEIARINATSGDSEVTISAETFNLLELCKYYSELSKGAFDVTVGPITREWGFGKGAVPKQPLAKEQIDSLLKLVGSRHIILSGNKAFLDQKGIEINLGGIAKGYAVDVCGHQLLGRGIRNVLINLGGNIRCFGYAHGHEPWKIGVRNPFYPKQSLGTLRLSNGQSVATSGNYERFVTINHRRYAHIIDPRTGYPVEGMASVTVISPSAVEADALSTALFVQGIKEGLNTLKKTRSCDALFVLDKRPVEIMVTEGFARQFDPDKSVSNRIFILKP